MTPKATIVVLHAEPKTATRLESALRTMRDGELRKAEVVAASTLADGIRILDAAKPKVILMGLTLEDSSGLKTLRTVRGKCPASPIIVLVDEDDHVTGGAALANGAQDYLYVSESRSVVIERAMTRAMERRR